MDKLIGVLGGMGSMASQLFYKMVIDRTEAQCDQEHVRMLILNDSSMPDRTKAILAHDYEKVDDKMLTDFRLLEKGGCEAIAITCNTAHFFADRLKDKIGIPIIHMIEETSAQIARNYPGGKVAILATDGTIQTELYQKRLKKYDLIPFTPSEEMQKIVMYQIYDRIKKGLPWDEEKWIGLEKYVKENNCDCAIMACTELSVIKEDNNLDDFYIDPMSVLAEKVVLFSGKKLK